MGFGGRDWEGGEYELRSFLLVVYLNSQSRDKFRKNFWAVC